MPLLPYSPTLDEPPSSLARRLEKPGDHLVDVPIICVITRFGLRNVYYLLPTYLDYLRVARRVKESYTPGFLHAAFLIESPRVCYSFSFWSSREAIPIFGSNVPYHVNAARRVFGRVSFDKERGPEVWSTKLQLYSVSNNLNWDNFDLREVILSTVK